MTQYFRHIPHALSLLILTVLAAPAPAGLPVADGAADAKQDFEQGVMMLLGGRDMPAATYDLGGGLMLEVATDACALGPDPDGYIADYNAAMKRLIKTKYGTDVDEVMLRAEP